jgi:hypothetical protein
LITTGLGTHCTEHKMNVRTICITSAALLAIASIASEAQPPDRLASTVKTAARSRGKETEFTTLTIRDIPAGTTLRVTCIGRGCPFGTETTKYPTAQPELSLRALLYHALLEGTVLQIVLQHERAIGQVFEWAMRRSAQPRLTTLCLPVGATKPTKC